MNIQEHELKIRKIKKKIYVTLIIIFPILLLFIIELLFRIFYTVENSDPYINLYSPISIFTEKEYNGVKYAKVTHSDAYNKREIEFIVKKPSNTFRIFCIGGSASAGWPHPSNEIYSEYLKETLNEIYSDKKIEVINTSAHAFASYRVRLIFNDIIRFDPDLIIVYSGNNEFIEKRNYIFNSTSLRALMKFTANLKTMQIIRKKIFTKLFPANTLSGEGRTHYRYSIISKVNKTALELRKNPRQFNSLKKHYAFSIEHMARLAEQNNIPLFLLSIPVNLRDWRPNVSYNSISGKTLNKWQYIYMQAKKEFLRKNYKTAILKFTQANQLDPIYAESYYFIAKAYEKLGNNHLALKFYRKANDMDHNPFRAISFFNKVIRNIANKYSNVSLIDLEEMFIKESGNRAPGFEMFLDYVHPTISANLFISKKITETIVKNSILESNDNDKYLDISNINWPHKRVYDEEHDLKLQRTLLWLMGLMHQYDSMLEKAKDILKRYPNSEEISPFAHDILNTFSEFISLEDSEIMEIPINFEQKEKIMTKYHNFYNKYYIYNK